MQINIDLNEVKQLAFINKSNRKVSGQQQVIAIYRKIHMFKAEVERKYMVFAIKYERLALLFTNVPILFQ